MDPDRARLKEVQQTDLTESRINQDFLDWLKNKGPSWLLAILIVLVVVVGWDKYGQYKTDKVAAAFFDLDEAFDPEKLERVAEDHTGILSVPEQARLKAADAYLIEVQIRRDLGNIGFDDTDEPLTDEELTSRLHRARDLYQQVLDATDGDAARTLFSLQARLGLAAVAESLGEFDTAAALYQQIEQEAGNGFPNIAIQATKRLASLDSLRSVGEIPAQDDLPRPSVIDPLLRDLLKAVGDEGDDDDAGDDDAAEPDTSRDDP